jgi:biotin transport system substrate-specific component
VANASPTATASSLRVRALVAAALLAALTAAVGPFSIPVQPVPITLQTFCVALAAMLLPPGWAAGSMALYVAIGAAGLPVFSKGGAGLSWVAGPTGGYLVGFIVAAGVGSLVRVSLRKTGATNAVADVGAGIVLLTIIYGLGTAWLAYSLNVSLAAAAALGTAPFVIGDVVKVGVAILIAEAVRKAGVSV